MNLWKLSTVILIFVLFSCSSGESQQDSPAVDEGTDTEQQFSVPVNIKIPASLENTQLKILSKQEELDYVGIGSQISVTDAPQFVIALDENDKMIYMSLTSGNANETVELNEVATAVSLLYLTPSIGFLSTEQSTLFLPILKGLPEITVLAIEIAKNVSAIDKDEPLWSTQFNPALQLAMTDAINAAVLALEGNHHILSIVSNNTINQALSSSHLELKRAVVLNPENQIASGIKVKLSYDDNKKDKYFFSVTNSANRWVNIEFNLGQSSPVIKLLEPGGSSGLYELPGIDITGSEDNKTTIDVYGPGVGTVPDGKNSSLIFEPTTKTFITRILIPFTSRAIGGDCAREFFGSQNFSKIAISVTTKLAETTNAKDISKNVLSNLAFSAINTTINAARNSALTCMTKGAAKKLLSYTILGLGQIKAAVDAAALTYKIGPTLVDIASSNPHEQFHLVNNVILVGEIGFDSNNAVEVIDDNQSCPQDTKCKSFYWDEVRSPDGLSIDFNLKCKAGCKSSLWGGIPNSFPENGELRENGDTGFKHTFQEEGTYEITAIILDNHDAFKLYVFNVEIIKNKPQIKVEIGGVRLADVPKNNNVMENVFVCNNNNSVTKTITFTNTGLGDLSLKWKGVLVINNWSSVPAPPSGLGNSYIKTLKTDEKTSLTIEYACGATDAAISDLLSYSFSHEYSNSSETNVTLQFRPTINLPIPPLLKGYYEVSYSWGDKLLLEVDDSINSTSSGRILYPGYGSWFYPNFGTSFSARYGEEIDVNQTPVEYIGVAIYTGGCLSEGFRLYGFDTARESFTGKYTSARCHHGEDVDTDVGVKYLGESVEIHVD